MNVFTRGVRNAFRNGTRTVAIVLILGLSVGLALSMLIAGQAIGDKITSVKSTIGSAISVSPAGMRGFEGGGNALTAEQASQVANLSHVASVTSSLSDRLSTDNTNLQSSLTAGNLGARFNQESSSSSTAQSNMMPANDTNATGERPAFTPPMMVTGTNNSSTISEIGAIKLMSGENIDATGSANEALIGAGLAEKNSLKVGDTFTAYGKTITVKGIIDTTDSKFAGNMIVMPLATLQSLTSQPGAVTAMTVTVDTVENSDTVVAEIKSALGSAVDVTSDQTAAESSLSSLESIKTVANFALIASVAAGGVIILLAMMMIVRERRREIGVLKAIGATNKTVTFQFAVESITLTMMAAVIGVVTGIFAAGPITKTLVNNAKSETTSQTQTQARPGGERGAMGGMRRGISQIGDVTASVNWSIVLYGLGAAFVIAIVGSVVSSWFITKVRPAEAVRAE